MKRIIPFSELKKSVDQAYEDFKSIKEGEINPLVEKPEHNVFGLSVCLADGTEYSKADSDIKSPIGAIGNIAVATLLLEQNGVDKLLEKSGMCRCGCKKNKPDVCHDCACPRSVRAISALEPTGDSVSKWNFIENRLIDLMGSSPDFNDRLYQKINNENARNNAVNAFEESDFYLYDDAASSLDLFAKLQSMNASAKQLALMGATIAADGVNPVSNTIVYDGEISVRVVAMIASKGMHHSNTPWLVASGLPASNSFGGAVLGILPGVMAIAAYSPEVNENGISVKGAKAIIEIMNRLNISVFGSADIEIDKNK